MKTISFITTNALKLQDVHTILGKKPLPVTLVHHALTLPELQASPDEISIHKCKVAASIVQGAVIIEDTILACNSLNGLPGPYVKAFINQIGVIGLFRMLADFPDKTAKATSTFAYTEGPDQPVRLFQGSMTGKIIAPVSGSEQSDYWGEVFQLDGYEISYAAMDAEEKNRVSHRYKALMQLRDYFINQI